jgi:2-polyprenyl-3-methyl-5-hydroxy-6-metoxy-1,4-benzoquinol methylase/Tfp pilus assembly protein PilF
MDYAQTALLVKTAKDEPDSAEKQFTAARYLLENHMPGEALPFLERASDLTQTAELAALAGTVAVSLGELDRAAGHFRVQLTREPEGPEAHFNLGLIAAARESWAEAAEHFRCATNLCPDSADWQNDFGVALHKSGDLAGAVGALSRAREIDPKHRDAAVNLADLFEALERREDAFKILADYLRYNPGDADMSSRKDAMFMALPETLRSQWVEPPLAPSVYDTEYFETHLGTEETTEYWQKHRGQKLDRRFATIVEQARAGNDDEVLELGCGRGELANYFATICKHVVAVDYSDAAIAIAREVCNNHANVELICCDAKDIAYDQRFALVVMTDVVEHLRDWEMISVLEKCLKALVPGGQLLLHSPVYGEIHLGGAEDHFAHYVPRVTFDFPVHVNLMTFDALRAAVIAAGFQVKDVRFDGKVILSAIKPGIQQKAPVRAEAKCADEISGLSIALFASNDAFLGDLQKHLGRRNEVRVFTGGSRAQMERELARADLAWFEWCDEFLVAATALPKTCPIVCRLHSYEAFTEKPEHVDWSKVDGLMYVNQSVRELMEGRVPSDLRTAVIPNGVDFDRYRFPERKTYGKKVAFAGYLNFKKNPGFLVACFEALHKYDPEFTFHIAGQYQGAHIQVFLEHLLPRLPFKVQFDGWVDDVAAWFEDKDYVLSTSYFESFHYSIAEGIARGVLPLVYNWRGSENCYPASVRFDTLDECVELVKRYRREPDPLATARQLRDQLAARFSLSNQVVQTERFLGEVLAVKPQTPSIRPAIPDFDTKGYWESRLSRNYNLAGVGFLDLGEAYNRFMYRLRKWRLAARLSELQIEPSGKRILDIGSGTGFFLEFWKAYNPASLEGLDITDTSVARLRERFSDLPIHHADISCPGITLPGPYDVISAFDVLIHVVDDEAFARALENIAGLLAPNGYAIITDGCTQEPYTRNSEHYRARTEAEYRAHFERLGLSVVTVEPLFAAMNAPVDLQRVRDPELREVYDELWDVTQSLFGKDGLKGREADLAARMAFLHEQIHLKTNAPSPSAKLLIARKGI